jgi:integrase
VSQEQASEPLPEPVPRRALGGAAEPVDGHSGEPGGAELELAAVAAARLAALDAAGATYAAEQLPASTRRAHESDWRAWTTYTAALEIPDTSATVGALVGYVAFLERAGRAPNTIDRRLAGAVVGLRAHGAEPSREAIKAARTALNGYRRRLAEEGTALGRGQAPALSVQHLRRISLACPPTRAGVRDRAVVLIAFAIAGRRSEVAALRLDDIALDEQGLVVRVRFGKTAGSAREVAVPYGSHPGTCPVRAWLAWRDVLAEAGITEGAAFRRVDRHGRILGGLAGQSVGTIITAAADRAELDVHFTGHSARAGLATEARRAGHDATTVAKQGGWAENSRALGGYFRIVDRWSDNAVAGVGL